jgi:hypothetical protein
MIFISSPFVALAARRLPGCALCDKRVHHRSGNVRAYMRLYTVPALDFHVRPLRFGANCHNARSLGNGPGLLAAFAERTKFHRALDS